ncbi:DUF4913 domain-containing protein [Kocuria carniphila]|uniref:DUF4913 domain-containing protein n=1 Tax=Kocuria carniphila TaxID=262208 RepID=UPI0034DB2181
MDLNSVREEHDAAFEAEEAADELVYPNVLAFVDDHLSLLYQRRIDDEGRSKAFVWCGQWWRHPEAVSRLTGLWRAWESLRKDPTTGLAVWWRDYADPMVRALFDEQGTFQGCTPKTHAPKVTPLTTVPPPEGLFD